MSASVVEDGGVHANGGAANGGQGALGGQAVPVHSALTLLKKFQEIQRQRAQLYARFSLGHKRFLENKQEGPFRSLMSDLTASFNDLSRQVIAAEGQLSEGCAQPDLALLLRRVQVLEREKLQLTLSLQALKQAGAAGSFSWQQQPGAGAGAEAGGSFGAPSDVDPLEPHTQGHSHDHEHAPAQDHAQMHQHADGGHACCGHSHGEAPPPEPSEEEYNGALAEAMQLLNSCVLGINEVLEEVACAVEELSG